jgi:hypothetical protein
LALRGTLKDFGIADIFQLIGHQGKSGRLTVKNRDQQVDIYFCDGSVVRAAPGARQKKDLLGGMLVRSEVITQQDLDRALEVQQTTLKRLGDILAENVGLDREVLTTFTKLQTTETLYRLFLWDSGSYEFENTEVVKPEDPNGLIRSENILMEGFRQVDEWPMIRKKIAGYGMTFYKLEDLDELAAQEASTGAAPDDDPFGDLDAAFGEFEGGGSTSTGRLRNVGENERLVYALITHDRDVQKIIDLSRLGEFETCKALCNLIDAQIVEPLAEGSHNKPSAAATVGGITSRQSHALGLVLRAVLLVVILVGAYVGVAQLDVETSLMWRASGQGHIVTSIQQILSRGQMQRIEQALAVYRSQTGRFPPGLQMLVEDGLVRQDDLHFPWRGEYIYEPRGDSYTLLRPLY